MGFAFLLSFGKDMNNLKSDKRFENWKKKCAKMADQFK